MATELRSYVDGNWHDGARLVDDINPANPSEAVAQVSMGNRPLSSNGTKNNAKELALHVFREYAFRQRHLPEKITILAAVKSIGPLPYCPDFHPNKLKYVRIILAEL